VILATVGVGLVQLAELRRATQLEGVMAVAEMFGTPKFLVSLRFLRNEFQQRFKNDAAFREEFLTPLGASTVAHPEHNVLMVFELVGAYIKHGLVNGEAVFDLASTRIARAWESLAPAVATLRETRGDSLAWDNAEFLAREASEWLERHTPKSTA
jgi:hypothetical protein